jgi:hypothetical protein
MKERPRKWFHETTELALSLTPYIAPDDTDIKDRRVFAGICQPQRFHRGGARVGAPFPSRTMPCRFDWEYANTLPPAERGSSAYGHDRRPHERAPIGSRLAVAQSDERNCADDIARRCVHNLDRPSFPVDQVVRPGPPLSDLLEHLGRIHHLAGHGHADAIGDALVSPDEMEIETCRHGERPSR